MNHGYDKTNQNIHKVFFNSIKLSSIKLFND